MSKTIKTSILIHASKEKVWAILSDFENYNQWNPFILSIQGEVKIGHKISVQVMAPGSKLMSFEPRILSFERNKEWIWEGILFSKILFRGEHQFQLVDHGDGTTTFHHNEIFKGLLVPFLQKQLDTKTRMGFEAMNRRLKEKAELESLRL